MTYELTAEQAERELALAARQNPGRGRRIHTT